MCVIKRDTEGKPRFYRTKSKSFGPPYYTQIAFDSWMLGIGQLDYMHPTEHPSTPKERLKVYKAKRLGGGIGGVYEEDELDENNRKLLSELTQRYYELLRLPKDVQDKYKEYLEEQHQLNLESVKVALKRK